jgi:hypothetical protein
MKQNRKEQLLRAMLKKLPPKDWAKRMPQLEQRLRKREAKKK